MTEPEHAPTPTAIAAAETLLGITQFPKPADNHPEPSRNHKAAVALRPQDPARLSLLLKAAERVTDIAVAQAWLTITTCPTGSEEVDDILAYIANRAATTAAKVARVTLVNHMAGTALLKHPHTISPDLILTATGAALHEAERILSNALRDAAGSVTEALEDAPHLAKDPAKGREVLTELTDSLAEAIQTDFTAVTRLLQPNTGREIPSEHERLAAD